MKLLWQSSALIGSFVVIFIWQNTPLSEYTVQILGLLIALYLIINAKHKNKGFITLGKEGVWGVFILNALIFLLIFATGGLNSALFFTLYFLSFGLAFIFDPLVIIIFLIGSFAVFYPELSNGDFGANLLKIGSLFLISPLAYFFGKQFQKSDRDKAKLEETKEKEKEAADIISEDIEEVLENEKTTLNNEDMEKLNEVLEETEELRADSKEKV